MKTTPETETATIHTDQLADLCNLTRRRLYQLAEEKKIPVADNGRFPMLATITALFAYYQGDEKNKSRQRFEAAQAEREELKLKREKKLVVPLADVKQALSETIVQFREEIMRLPRLIGSQTGNTAAQTIAEKVCGEALRECSRRLIAIAEQDEIEEEAAKKIPAEK